MMRRLHEAKYAELTKKLESQQKAHTEELERLAEGSRRREAELASENFRLADELRDLRLSPSGSPPSCGLGATDSADPPPYESLQSSSSRSNEIYLNYFGCQIRQSDMDSIDGMFTSNIIQFWMEYLERNELSKFPLSRIVLLRPHEAERLVRPIIRLTSSDRRDLGVSNISKDTTHVFAPLLNHLSPNASHPLYWSLLLVSLVDGWALHYDFNNGGEKNAQALRATKNLGDALGRVIKFRELEDCPQCAVKESKSGVYTVITVRHLLVSRLLTANKDNVVNVDMSGKIIDGPGGKKETKRLIEQIRESRRRGSGVNDTR